MNLNIYYGVKEADDTSSFSQAQWLSPHALFQQLHMHQMPVHACLSFANACELGKRELIYPSELVVDERRCTYDLLLIAKYTDKYGSLKLKNVYLSHLINDYNNNSNSNNNNSSSSNKLYVLSLPKDSFYWCQVDKAHSIPKYALRVGYDHFVKQFSYIGRMCVHMRTAASTSSASITSSSPTTTTTTTNNIGNLIGTLTHIYEYIPAIVLKLYDLSYLSEKMSSSSSFSASPSSGANNPHLNEWLWSKLRAAVLSNHNNNSNYSSSSINSPPNGTDTSIVNSNEINFNLISNNYQVLCMRKQPASLKRLCRLRLVQLNDAFVDNARNNTTNTNNTNNNEWCVGSALQHDTLPLSMRQLLWPSSLEPGECVCKRGKMRSPDGTYEMGISSAGSLRFVRYAAAPSHRHMAAATFEKNVESVLVTAYGVYIIYDSKQATRRPTMLYKHRQQQQQQQANECVDKQLPPVAGTRHPFVLELCDDGWMRASARHARYDLLDLNELLSAKCSVSQQQQQQQQQQLASTTTTTSSGHVVAVASSSDDDESRRRRLMMMSEAASVCTSVVAATNGSLLVVAENVRELANILVKIIYAVMDLVKTVYRSVMCRYLARFV